MKSTNVDIFHEVKGKRASEVERTEQMEQVFNFFIIPIFFMLIFKISEI